jgi:hypothetical protein
MVELPVAPAAAVDASAVARAVAGVTAETSAVTRVEGSDVVSVVSREAAVVGLVTES